MAIKNETAVSMTADLIHAALGTLPSQAASSVQAAPPAQTPQEPPAAAAGEPPDPGQTPPVQSEPPKAFDPTTIQSRFTAPPPPPQTPAEPTDIPDAPPAADAGQTPDQKSNYTWAQLRTKAKTAEREAEKARAEAEAAKAEAKRAAEAQAKLAEEIETQRRREQDLTEKLGRLSLAESPEFQQKYDLKLSEVTTRLGKALVKFAGVDEADASKQASALLSADPKQLPDMLGDLNPSVAGMILSMTSEAAAIDEAQRVELANWRQTGAAVSADVARKSVVEAAESRRKMAVDAIEAAKAYGNPVFASTDPRVTDIAAGIAQEFHGFVQTATEDQLIRAAAEGYAAPFLYEELNRMQSEILSLRDQLSGRVRAGNPPVFPSGGYTPPPPPPAQLPNVVPAGQANSARSFATESAREAIRRLNGV